MSEKGGGQVTPPHLRDLFGLPPLTAANPAAPAPRKCRRHQWEHTATEVYCARCGTRRRMDVSRRGRNNRTRGNREELTVARRLNGRKMGPLGLPWDVEMPGYARLQVKKLANPPSLRAIASMLAAIPGPEMGGVVWVEPGKGGEQLIVFRLRDFADRHRLPKVDE